MPQSAIDADGAGMGAADRDGHPADPDRERIAAERAEVERLDRDAFVEAEVAQAAGLACRSSERPVDRRDARAACRSRSSSREGRRRVICD